MNKSCKKCYWCERYDDVNGNWFFVCLKYDYFINESSKTCKKYKEIGNDNG
jgi:hypothetical protein